jgi:hypothetical protein
MSTERKLDKGYRLVFGASMPRQVVQEIDRVRGDTPRSLWLQRLAVKELQRVKKGNFTLLQSASQVSSPEERNAVTGASQSVPRNHNNYITREAVVEAAASVSSPPTIPPQEGAVSVSR